MQMPARGRLPDLTRAKRQMRALVRIYHPDVTGGDAGKEEAYQSVIEAFQLIERAHETSQQEKTHEK